MQEIICFTSLVDNNKVLLYLYFDTTTCFTVNLVRHILCVLLFSVLCNMVMNYVVFRAIKLR